MIFYDREQEIAQLQQIDSMSESNANFTVIIGRRRTGKTTLITKAFENKRYLYFFISNNSEQMLCNEFQQQAEQLLNIHFYGNIDRFAKLIEELMIFAKKEQLTIVIDEFQRLANILSGIMSELQQVWDKHNGTARIHLIACGSIYSMMKRIFENSNEPLFGRCTAKMTVKPFCINVLKKILRDYNPAYTPEDLLMLYAITGGVAKYVALLMDNKAVTKELMLQYVCQPTSVFLSEGVDLLVGEFGKHFSIYYSIMQLIANGKTSQSEIDSIIKKNTGRYLDTLENEYTLINRRRPMFSKPTSQGIKWSIGDCFLRFWFRFIEPNRTLIERDKYALLKEYIDDNYTQYSGTVLEQYFRQLYGEKERVTEVSNWWDKKGENEIDLIAIEGFDKRITVAEVKRNIRKYNEEELKRKFALIDYNFSDFTIVFRGLSLDDM